MPHVNRPAVRRIIVAGSSIGDRDWVAELLRSVLGRGCELVAADTGEAALRHAQSQSQAQAEDGSRVLLAGPLSDTDPLGLIQRLSGSDQLTACPMVVILPGHGRELGAALLRAGAQDYIGWSWLSPCVLARAVDNARVRWIMERDLRERDAALRRSEAFARGVLNSLPQHVLVLDDAGRVQAVNESWERFVQGRASPLANLRPGANYLDACREAAQAGDEGAGEVLRQLEPLLAGQASECMLEYPWPAAGAAHWFLMHARRPYHGHGLILSHMDISARKQVEEQLRQAQRLTQTIIDGAGALVFAKDLQGRYFLTNRAWRESVGMSEQQAMGSTDDAVYGPQVARPLRHNDERVLSTGRRIVVEEKAYAHGRAVTYLTSKFPLLAEDGRAFAVCGVSTDVTEQKQAQEDVKRLLEEERHYTGLLAKMAQASQLVHASLSPDEIAHVLTQQARELVGAQRAATTLNLGGPQAGSIRALSRCCDDAGADEPPAQGVLTVPLAGKAGQAMGALQVWGRESGAFTAQDESVLVQLAAIASTGLENARLVASLREADHRKDEFLATLAHELRNPLAPIRNGLEILRRAGQLAGPAARAREMMDRQLAHMVRLVDDLMDVSRISRGKVDLRLARISVQAVLAHAVEATRPAIEAGRHHLAQDLPSRPLWVDGDLTRLAQVVSNLLHNAAKYTAAEGRIELSARAQEGQAVIRVTDNGSGIPAEMLPRIFDLFAQADRTRASAQGGLGIGLSLVRQLVELHGGQIGAHSEGLAQGSRFTVRLPLAAAPPQAPAGAPPPPAASTPSRVLVVDDNIDGAESLALMLQLLGHEVQCVHDGAQALALVGSWRPEVVLLDIGLPGLSGYEVARRLRALPATADALLVAVTGWGTQEDQRKSAEAGFDHHLTKPVEAAALEAVLGRVHAGVASANTP